MKFWHETIILPYVLFQSISGRFWSVDQQAMLFPAKISEDSPWKQETATSRLDPDTENRTQEAIDIYFTHHHKITSPEDVPRTNAVYCDRGSPSIQTSVSHITTEDLGGSPDLRGRNEQDCNNDVESIVPTPKGLHEF